MKTKSNIQRSGWMHELHKMLAYALAVYVVLGCIACGGGGGGGSSSSTCANPPNCSSGYHENTTTCGCDLDASPLINNNNHWIWNDSNGDTELSLELNSDGTGSMLLPGTGNGYFSTFNCGKVSFTWEETDPTTITISTTTCNAISELSQIDPAAGSISNPTSFTANFVTSKGTQSFEMQLESGTF
jgi:hypothetical protein